MEVIFDNDKYSNTYSYYKLCSSYHNVFKPTDIYGNCKTKIYPDGTTNSIVCRSSIFAKKGFEKIRLSTICERYSDAVVCYSFDKDTIDRNIHFSKQNNSDFKISSSLVFESCKEENKRIRHDSVKRAKDSIFDYAFCNKFDYFFTGTIDPKRINSKSPAELLQPVQSWLKNYRSRYGIQYIMVAEYHKKGGIHFHGLINFENLSLIDSGTKSYKGYKKPMRDYKAIRLGLNPEEGKIVYNIPNWRFGFTTCIKTYGDSCAVSHYISKYLTKDCSKIFGKFFWHSRGLRKPDISVDTVDYDSVCSKEYFGCYKYVFLRGDYNRQVFLFEFDEVIFDSACCYSAVTGEIYFEILEE